MKTRPHTRHANREPKQSRQGQQQIRATASHGKSRACAPLRTGEGGGGLLPQPSDHRQARRPTHEASGEAGERDSPRQTPPQSTSLWYGIDRRHQPVRDRPRRAARESRLRGKHARPPFTIIAPLGLVRPMTRTHVRLLGPSFKTGRVGHRPFARRERRGRPLLCCTTVAGLPGHRRFPPSPAHEARDVGVPVQPGLRRPQQRVAATYITGGNTPAGAGSESAGTPKNSWVASANPAPGRHVPTS